MKKQIISCVLVSELENLNINLQNQFQQTWNEDTIDTVKRIEWTDSFVECFPPHPLWQSRLEGIKQTLSKKQVTNVIVP
jgi:hypothetical protein